MLLGISIGLGLILFFYLMVGIIKVDTYKSEIEYAFQRDPRPFEPHQLWIVKAMMRIFWIWIDWEEVFYYDTGMPEWRRRSE